MSSLPPRPAQDVSSHPPGCHLLGTGSLVRSKFQDFSLSLFQSALCSGHGHPHTSPPGIIQEEESKYFTDFIWYLRSHETLTKLLDLILPQFAHM